MDFLTTNSSYMMEKAMGFLWTKQAAILDNIANAETPNYKAKNVTFEEELKEKLEKATSRSSSGRGTKGAVRDALEAAEVTVSTPAESTRMDDNGVNTTEQSVEMIRNAYQLQYVMNAISSDLSVLRTAVRGQ